MTRAKGARGAPGAAAARRRAADARRGPAPLRRAEPRVGAPFHDCCRPSSGKTGDAAGSNFFGEVGRTVPQQGRLSSGSRQNLDASSRDFLEV